MRLYSLCRLSGLLLFLSLLFPVRAVYAHAHLLSQLPPAGGIAATTTQLLLTFSEGIEPAFSRVQIFDGRNQAVETMNPIANVQDKTQLVVPLRNTLPAGSYRVEWRVVSVDGHKTQGDYAFRVQ